MRKTVQKTFIMLTLAIAASITTAAGAYADDAKIHANGQTFTVSDDIALDTYAKEKYGALAEQAGVVDAQGNIVSKAAGTEGAVALEGGAVKVAGEVSMFEENSVGADAAGEKAGITTHDIVMGGADSKGATAADGGQVIARNIYLNDYAANSTAAYAEKGGKVGVNSDINSKADGAYGARANENGEVDVTGNISMTGEASTGAAADGGAVWNTGDIRVNGIGSTGAEATNGGQVITRNIYLDERANRSTAAYAETGGKVGVNSDINSKAADSTGASANDNSEVNVTGTITMYEKDSTGARANGGTVWNTGDIVMNGASSDGARASGGGQVITRNIYLNDYADGSHAAYAEAGGKVAVNSDINSKAAGSYGAYALRIGKTEQSEVDVTGNITMYEKDSIGAAADGGTVWNSGGVIMNGAGSTGAQAMTGGQLVTQSVLLDNYAANSYGAHAWDGGVVSVNDGIQSKAAITSGVFAAEQGTVNVGGNISMEKESSTAVIADGGSAVLSNGSIRTANDGASWAMLADNGGTIALNSMTAGAASGNRNLLGSATSGTVTAYDSALTGDITQWGTTDGTLALALQNGSTFTGAANLGDGAVSGAKIDMTTDALGDRWNVTADSNIKGTLTNRGAVDFGQAADSGYKKITAGDFAGAARDNTAGKLLMKSDINAGRGDAVNGSGKATGTTQIDLRNSAYAGKAKMDQALVRMDDGAGSDASITLADNAQTENGILDAGAWNYVLDEQTNGSAKAWNMKRNGLAATGQGIMLGAVTPELWYTEVATLFDRMSEYKDPGYQGGIWASIGYRKIEFDGDGAAYGMPGFDAKTNAITVGYDKKSEHSNGTWFNGIMAGYGREERENLRADSDTDSFHAALYTAYRRADGFYLSALAKYNLYDTDLTVNDVDKLTHLNGYDSVDGGLNQKGLGMSVMAGKRFAVGDKGWYWEPQAQLSYMRIFGDDYTTNSGLDVDVSATTSLRGRAGLLFGKAVTLNNGAQLDVFADLSYNKEFDGETDIWMSGGKYTRDLGDAWGSYGLGFSWRLNSRSYLGGRIAYGSGSDRTEPISATLGLLFEMN